MHAPIQTVVAIIVAMQLSAVATNAPGDPGATPSVVAPSETGDRESDNVVTLPIGRLAPHAGFDDDASYVQSVGDRVASLTTEAARTEDAERKTAMLLSAANQLLGYQLEPACSRKLIGLSPTDPEHTTEKIRVTMDRIGGLIAQVKQQLDQEAGPDGKAVAPWIGLAALQINAMEAFAGALRVYLLPIEADKPEVAIRRAASHLSALREDPRPEVSAAATFWQAALRAMGENPQRALPVLDAYWSAPPTGSLPYSFFGRLLRCRLLADRGGEAVALSLLMQIEDQCEDWFEQNEARQNAVRATQFTGARIVIAWHDRLDASKRTDERAWCRQRIKKLAEVAFPSDGNTMLRLTPAVPIITQAKKAAGNPEEADPLGG